MSAIKSSDCWRGLVSFDTEGAGSAASSSVREVAARGQRRESWRCAKGAGYAGGRDSGADAGGVDGL